MTTSPLPEAFGGFVCTEENCLVCVYVPCALPPGHRAGCHEDRCPSCNVLGVPATMYDVNENPPVTIIVPEGFALGASPVIGYMPDGSGMN